MKRLWLLVLPLLLVSSVALAADQWDKTAPQGASVNMSDIDTSIQTNNAALDRLLQGYRRGCSVVPDTSNQVKVLAGQLAIPNAAGSVIRYRSLDSATAVTWSDIDTGSEANSTQYYVYATADTDVTGVVLKISASSTAPSGSTYYLKLGYFYNDSGGSIVDVGSVSGGGAVNVSQSVGTVEASTTTSTYADIPDMDLTFISTGRPVLILFHAPMKMGYADGVNCSANFRITVDGVEKIFVWRYMGLGTSDSPYRPVFLPYIDVMSAGTHTIKAQWKTDGSGQTLYQYTDAAKGGSRILQAVEL